MSTAAGACSCDRRAHHVSVEIAGITLSLQQVQAAAVGAAVPVGVADSLRTVGIDDLLRRPRIQVDGAVVEADVELVAERGVEASAQRRLLCACPRPSLQGPVFDENVATPDADRSLSSLCCSAAQYALAPSPFTRMAYCVVQVPRAVHAELRASVMQAQLRLVNQFDRSADCRVLCTSIRQHGDRQIGDAHPHRFEESEIRIRRSTLFIRDHLGQ